MKKRILIITALYLFLLTACSSKEETKESQEVWIDVNEIYTLTLDQATEKYGELTNHGEFTDDGIESIIYSSQDDRYEFHFSPDGTKLNALYIFGKEDEFTLNSKNDIASAFNLDLSDDPKMNKDGAPRFYDIDKTNYIKEAYILNTDFSYPMSANLIQIWFK